MYSANPSPGVARKLNRHASTIILGGIFLTFGVVLFMAMCKMPCEHANMERHLMQSLGAFHEGHKSIQRDVKPGPTGNYVRLIILIISEPKNLERRNAIRRTWLSNSFANVTHYFVVATAGLSPDDAITLQLENTHNNDLLMLATMRDSYKQLTSKVLDSLKWAHTNFDFDFVLKADDDTFIRVDKVLVDLDEKHPHSRLYWGFFDGRANVKKSGQWAEYNWVLCDKYLPHARGGGYVLSYDLVGYVVRNANLLQKFNSEDISIGAWLGPLDIHRVHDPRFDTEYKSRGCSNRYIVTHKQSVEDMEQKWRNIQSTGVLCTREEKLRASYVYNWKALPSNCCIRNDTNVP